MKILYPPRPKGKITPNQLPEYEKSGGWVVQRKFNGTRVVIHVQDGDVYILNRHGEPPRQFTLTNKYKKEFMSLNIDNKECWLDGELLDAKTKNKDYKGKIVLFDVLQAGRYLFGSPNLLGRQFILHEICGHSPVRPAELEPGGIALQITPNIWLAETFDSNFAARFKDFIDRDEIEGLVLKRIDSTLDNFGKSRYDVGWQIRCRKQHAGGSYDF